MEDQVLALVSRHLAGSLRPTANGNYQTTCPFHKGGEEKTPSFSVNVQKGVFNCFTCHEAGDVKRLLILLGLPRRQVDAETASIQPILDRNREAWKLEKEHFLYRRDPFRADYVLPEALVGVFEWMPMKLVNDGFDPVLLKNMEVGFDRRNNRITYPLRDVYGNLAGFSGGTIVPGHWPKYKVYQGGRRGPDRRWIEGDFGQRFDQKHPGYRCENHDFLWNFDRVFPRLLTGASEPDATVFVVEGFKACLWMKQSGFHDTVALMGSYISERQQRLLHTLGGRVCLFLDNDAPGRRATFNVADLLFKPLYGRIDVVPYPEVDLQESLQGEYDTQPDDYQSEAVSELVKQRIPFVKYFNLMKERGVW